MVTQSESVNLADDRILEIQLFEQLERRAHIRLCELMRLRRVSRNQNVLLIDAAFREGRVTKALAIDITTDLGLNWTVPGPRTELSSGDELDHSDSMLDESESLLDWMPEPLIATHPASVYPEDIDFDDGVDMNVFDTMTPSEGSASQAVPDGIGKTSENRRSKVASGVSGAKATENTTLEADAIAGTSARRFPPVRGALLTQSQRVVSGHVDDGAFWSQLGAVLQEWLAMATETALDESSRALCQELIGRGQAGAKLAEQSHQQAFFKGFFTGADDSHEATKQARLRATLHGTGGISELQHLKTDRGILTLAPLRTFPAGGRIDLALKAGRYLLKLSSDAGLFSVPLELTGTQEHVIEIRRPKPYLDLVGFALIYGGTSVVGGDPLAWRAEPKQDIELPSFLIGRSPVSCAEYVRFLNEVCENEGEDISNLHVPRMADGTPYWAIRNGQYEAPDNDTTGLRWGPNLPVVGINQADAIRYCRWLDDTNGGHHRLPTAAEWEKAARGPHGAAFPWGDRWDPQFCHTKKATSGAATRNPGIDFIYDQSLYGVADIAGRVSEWTSTRMGDAETVTKGGHWLSGALESRAASRFSCAGDQVSPTIGFRVLRELIDEDFEPLSPDLD